MYVNGEVVNAIIDVYLVLVGGVEGNLGDLLVLAAESHDVTERKFNTLQKSTARQWYVIPCQTKYPKDMHYNKILKSTVFTLNRPAGVNFTNILRAAYSYESFARSFFVLNFKVCTFFGAKISAQKLHMLAKLSTGRISKCSEYNSFTVLPDLRAKMSGYRIKRGFHNRTIKGRLNGPYCDRYVLNDRTLPFWSVAVDLALKHGDTALPNLKLGAIAKSWNQIM